MATFRCADFVSATSSCSGRPVPGHVPCWYEPRKMKANLCLRGKACRVCLCTTYSSGLHGTFFPRALWNNKDACTCRHALPEGKCRHRQILAGRKRRSPDFAAGWPRCAEQKNRHRACASAVQEAEAEFTEQSALDEDGSVGFILPPSEPLAVIVGGGTCGVLLVGGLTHQKLHVRCML